MNIVFRTDASNDIGTGHVTRCLTLANALRKEGANVLFICRKHQGHLIERIESQGFDVVVLPVTNHTSIDFSEASSSKETLTHAHWLGSYWETDAEATIEALGDNPVDWLVVDHYGLDYRWESAMREHVKRIMVIDDLADRKHECDLLLDQNLVANYETRYDDLVPDHTTTLLGPTYALLQPEYAELHPRTPPRTGPVKRILISFGGVDSHNLTGLAVKSFIDLHRPDIEVDVVLSKNNEYFEELSESTKKHPNIHLHDTVPSLAPLMVKADLAIGAGGATTWERLCLRLPSLVITLADNQIPIAKELHERGVVKYLGRFDEVSVSSLRHAINSILQKNITLEYEELAGEYNGTGTALIASLLNLSPKSKLFARHANNNDMEILFQWANDPITRANAFNSNLIELNEHINWFEEKLNNHGRSFIYIVHTISQMPIGQVRFEHNDSLWEVHYALSPNARGNGLGSNLLSTGITKFLEDVSNPTIVGHVKQNNIASQKIFKKLGFTEANLVEYYSYSKVFPQNDY